MGKSFVLTRADIINILIESTTSPELLSDFLHVGHVLFSALNLLERCSNISNFHLERKIKKLSIKNNIYNLTIEELELIQNDDIQERAEHNGRIVYLDSVYEKGYDMMDKLIKLHNVELRTIYKKHPEINKETMSVINECTVSVMGAFANAFGYTIVPKSNL